MKCLRGMVKGCNAVVFAVFLAAGAAPGVCRAEFREQLLTPAQEWAVALSAFAVESAGRRHSFLSPAFPDMENYLAGKTVLFQWGEIRSRADLLRALQWLDKEGGFRYEFDATVRRIGSLPFDEYQSIVDRLLPGSEERARMEVAFKYRAETGDRSILAWDYGNYVFLLRYGYLTGLISEDEAWEKIMPVARMMQNTFGSWQEYGRNYLIGREYWAPSLAVSESRNNNAVLLKLLKNMHSPWQRRSWHTVLYAPAPGEPGSSSSAVIAAARDHYACGLALSEKGAWEQAAVEFSRAIMADHRYAAAYSSLAEIYLRQRRYDDAAAVYRAGIENNPDQPYLHIGYGLACWHREQRCGEASLQAFTAAVELMPETASDLPPGAGIDDYLFERGRAAYHEGDYAKAMRDYDAALRVNPGMGAAYYNLACCFARTRQYDSVLAPLSAAIGLNEDFRGEARRDRDFSGMRDRREFCALTGLDDTGARWYYILGAALFIALGIFVFIIRRAKDSRSAGESCPA